jgi:hypothetical protein
MLKKFNLKNLKFYIMFELLNLTVTYSLNLIALFNNKTNHEKPKWQTQNLIEVFLWP